MDEFSINVGKRIRKKREELRFTMEKLSELARINDKYLYEIETGKKRLSAQILFKLSRSLGVTMDFLASGEENNEEYRMILSLLSGFNKSDIKKIEEVIRNIVAIKNNSAE